MIWIDLVLLPLLSPPPSFSSATRAVILPFFSDLFLWPDESGDLDCDNAVHCCCWAVDGKYWVFALMDPSASSLPAYPCLVHQGGKFSQQADWALAGPLGSYLWERGTGSTKVQGWTIKITTGWAKICASVRPLNLSVVNWKMSELEYSSHKTSLLFRCIDKVSMEEVTEYDTVIKCDHSYNRRCAKSLKTTYEAQQVGDRLLLIRSVQCIIW